MLPPPAMHGVPQMFGLPCTQLLNSSVFSTAFAASLFAGSKQLSLETMFLEDDDDFWAERHEPPPAGATVQSKPQGRLPSEYGIQWNAAPAGPAVAHANVSAAELLKRILVEELIRDGWASLDGSYMSVLPPPAVLQRQAGVMQASNLFSGPSRWGQFFCVCVCVCVRVRTDGRTDGHTSKRKTSASSGGPRVYSRRFVFGGIRSFFFS